ncbi:MAG: ORF6N domain-containing protein [Deltaproteobacteria bacterium]|nr:MAG: ORF6N domain-containing protein [Deltaproteobacteria bacterium]
MTDIVPIEQIASKIYFIRGAKVMLDRDLAALYEVETRILKRNVRRHIKRFPPDFMFELSKEEFNNWRSQFGISNGDRKGLRYAPMAFTEQGVAMLSSVLNSDRAIEVNIQIMRTFTKIRHMISANEEIKKEVDELRQQTQEGFKQVFEIFDRLVAIEEKPKRKIGF